MYASRGVDGICLANGGGKIGWYLVQRFGFTKDVALSPYGVDADTPRAGKLELAAKLADKHVDDFRLRLVHTAIKVAEEGGFAED